MVPPAAIFFSVLVDSKLPLVLISFQFCSVEWEIVTNNEYTKLISILNKIDDMNSKLEEMYKWYTLQTNVVEPIELKIDKFDDIVVTRSYKIYNEIQKEFADYCKSQPYKTQDIISQALKEFLQKYK